LKLYPLRKYP